MPAVAQDAATGEVLMVAWMNAEAYAETLRTGQAVYFSRSRGKLWRKGEESGHVQTVRAIYVDCDADTILLKVEQVGVGLPRRLSQLLLPAGDAGGAEGRRRAAGRSGERLSRRDERGRFRSSDGRVGIFATGGSVHCPTRTGATPMSAEAKLVELKLATAADSQAGRRL